MSRKPTPPEASSSRRRSAAKPVEAVGQTLERALDPLASAIKRAALPVSPLAVPFPRIPPIDGVEIATGRAGFYKHEREDLLVMRFAEGTSVAGVFTRHGVGSAPVDWCRRALAQSQGEDARALVVNAGCANAFTGKPGADAARRVASAVAKRFDCRQRDVMIASTGVIGVLLDDAKITQRLPEVDAALAPDGWAGAARAIMTTDTFPKGAFAEAEIDGKTVRIAGICKGSGMIAPDMATMLAFVATDADIAPKALQNPCCCSPPAGPAQRGSAGPATAGWPISAKSSRRSCWTWPPSWCATGRGRPSSCASMSRAPKAPPRRARSPGPSPRAPWSKPPSRVRTPTGVGLSWRSAGPTSPSTGLG